jgi:hypothetical protein
MECRVSLGRAPIGSKCLAPCGCIGSQQWIQFSVLNRLRRKDPEQWQYCQTCQQKFNYDILYKHGGVYGNLLSYFLDNLKTFRPLIFIFGLMVLKIVQFDSLVKRFLVSKLFWSQYPRWGKLVHFPILLQYWGARCLIAMLMKNYSDFEKNIILLLSDYETSLIEPNLPVSVS